MGAFKTCIKIISGAAGALVSGIVGAGINEALKIKGVAPEAIYSFDKDGNLIDGTDPPKENSKDAFDLSQLPFVETPFAGDVDI